MKRLSPELIGILSVGVMLAGLVIAGHRGIHARLDRFDARLTTVQTALTELATRVAALETGSYCPRAWRQACGCFARAG